MLLSIAILLIGLAILMFTIILYYLQAIIPIPTPIDITNIIELAEATIIVLSALLPTAFLITSKIVKEL